MTLENKAVIGNGTHLQGRVETGLLEVFGHVEGDILATAVVVQPTGKLFGNISCETMDVLGCLQGEICVRGEMTIRKAGRVHGRVTYGRLAIEEGGLLSAEMRNVPPALAGDLELAVRRGNSVLITTADLDAIDPDDTPAGLFFTVSNPKHGSVFSTDAPQKPLNRFSLEDVQKKRVRFRHDGSESRSASFEVVVKDKSGATSGTPRTVTVQVEG